MSPRKKYDYLDKNRAERLYAERKKIEKNRKKFVEVNGLSYSNLENWETGRADIPIEMLKIILENGGDIHYILTGVRSENAGSATSADYAARIAELETRIEELQAWIEDKDEIISLQREKLESTSDNRDLVKIAAEVIEIIEQRRTTQGADESTG